MLQKPSLEELEGLSKTHLFLMDIGIWILSDRAIEVLMKRSLKEGTKDITYYDLYSDYGLALGEHPKTKDEEINQLSVAILPLPGGEFYHSHTGQGTGPKKNHAPESKAKSGYLYTEFHHTSFSFCRQRQFMD